MANLKDSPHFQIYDDYYTPKSAWEQINHLIPKDKTVCEAFMFNSRLSKSKTNLIELNNKVVGETDWDFFEKCEDLEYDLIISNPPFNKEIKIPILKKLVQLDKPFIIIMNSMNIYANYFNDIFKNGRKDLQIIIPKGKIHFEKLIGDKTELKSNTSFYCVYVAYKMNIPNEKLYLD